LSTVTKHQLEVPLIGFLSLSIPLKLEPHTSCIDRSKSSLGLAEDPQDWGRRSHC